MHVPSSHIICTAEQSKTLDIKTSEMFGIDGFTLMEIAGRSAAEIIRTVVDGGSHGIFLCGKGNNGGDALVAARYLAQSGCPVTVLFVSGTDELSPLAKKNLDLLQKIEQNDAPADITFVNSWNNFDESADADFIVDGMLGTGLNSKLRDNYKHAVNWANRQKVPCFAMDIPTGLHADSGNSLGSTVQATHTIAFGTLKKGLYINEGYKYRGEIHFCELPFPNYLKNESAAYLIDANWLPPFEPSSANHKYEAGVVYIIGGSEGLTGAAIMAAKSAWQEGVGAVILICPKGLLPVFENNLPQIIKKPVGLRDEMLFSEKHVEEALQIVQEKKGVVLIGPGIGRDKDPASFITGFLKKNDIDGIIDADALRALSKKTAWGKPERSSWILTPHPGELNILLDEPIKDDEHRMDKVHSMAAKKKCTLLSKGFPVILGSNEGQMFLSSYDNRSFSRAGFGDVLAGKIAAFKALGCNPEESCMRALLQGEQKMKQFRQSHVNLNPEPLDFI